MMVDKASIREAGLIASLQYMGAVLIYMIALGALLSVDVGEAKDRAGLPFIAAPMVILLLSVGVGAYLSSTSFLRRAEGPRVRWSIGRGIAIMLLSCIMGELLCTICVVLLGSVLGKGSSVGGIDIFFAMLLVFTRFGLPFLFCAIPFSIPPTLLYRRVVRRLLAQQEANVARAVVEDAAYDKDVERVG